VLLDKLSCNSLMLEITYGHILLNWQRFSMQEKCP
jgi:hypothetical protein